MSANQDIEYHVLSASRVFDLVNKVNQFLKDIKTEEYSVRIEGSIMLDREYARSFASLTATYHQVVVVSKKVKSPTYDQFGLDRS